MLSAAPVRDFAPSSIHFARLVSSGDLDTHLMITNDHSRATVSMAWRQNGLVHMSKFLADDQSAD